MCVCVCFFILVDTVISRNGMNIVSCILYFVNGHLATSICGGGRGGGGFFLACEDFRRMYVSALM